MDRLLLSIPAAADATSTCRETMYREIRAGRLPVVRIGRATRIPFEALKAWADARTETWDGEPWAGGAA